MTLQQISHIETLWDKTAMQIAFTRSYSNDTNSHNTKKKLIIITNSHSHTYTPEEQWMPTRPMRRVPVQTASQSNHSK